MRHRAQLPSQVRAKEDFSGPLAADPATRGDGSIRNIATLASTAISDTQQTFMSPTSPLLLRQILPRLCRLPSTPDNTIKLWNMASGRELGTLAGHNSFRRQPPGRSRFAAGM